MVQAQLPEASVRSELPENRSLRQSIRYSGRKTTRAKSEQRRLEILEATLRIAARDGLRGIKHRAVAREAGVPLAATTYYFRDIHELISDSFMLFAEKARDNLNAFYDTINLVLDTLPNETLRRGGAHRRELTSRLSAISTAYLHEQFTKRRQQVLAEQVFLMEALRDRRLAGLARVYREAWTAGLRQILERLDSPSPDRDAGLLVNVTLGMGYESLLNDQEVDFETLSETVERVICLVLECPEE
ncbi:TetR/AcrR family transcriptional regulator [Marinobacter sp. HL-58]|uniref:TetR/AcrR family transcriptional regulator n=1 Tax=Marinobacter sp. HL-58 TaxID=1479237 RepID=UPI000691F51B|nr:TetR family transcriptional regulator C-terminal domain-containing protein [Marinobacter sp. HL-58]KPP97733.1 MAG: TetR family transcriptional regulator [Marinobacter sp. HL-58]